jgi:hypothetical protein
MAHAGGRPSLYTLELAKRVCELIAIEPISLPKICAKYRDIPSHDTIKTWKATLPEFSAMYYEAKEEQADALADYTWERVQEVSEEPAAVAKASLELKFAQWQNARLAPKRWREKTEVKSDITANIALHEDKLKELE